MDEHEIAARTQISRTANRFEKRSTGMRSELIPEIRRQPKRGFTGIRFVNRAANSSSAAVSTLTSCGGPTVDGS